MLIIDSKVENITFNLDKRRYSLNNNEHLDIG